MATVASDKYVFGQTKDGTEYVLRLVFPRFYAQVCKTGQGEFPLGAENEDAGDLAGFEWLDSGATQDDTARVFQETREFLDDWDAGADDDDEDEDGEDEDEPGDDPATTNELAAPGAGTPAAPPAG